MNMAASQESFVMLPRQQGKRAAVQALRTGKLEVSALQLIEWAFQREKISLDFDEIERETGARPGVGMEYIMMERAKLGCRVQGGGASPRHHDADMVAASLASLSEVYGGRRMAVQIAELARAGEVPDWMGGAVPVCEPVAWRRCKHGAYAVAEVCRVPGQRWPADQLGKKADGSWCRVSYSCTARDVAAAQRRYLDWYRAIHHLRFNFQNACHLTSFTVTDALPPRAPWKGY